MKAALLITAILVTTGASPAAAQVHIFANAESAGTVRKFHQQDTWARAILDVARRPSGRWFQLVGSDIEGHGAVFCASLDGGGDPHYFVVEGRATAPEATTDARALARRFAAGREGYWVYWCGQFENRNRYPMNGVRGPVLPLTPGEQAALAVDARMSAADRRIRLIGALENALTHDPRDTPGYTAELAARGLLQALDLDPAAQAEADATAAERQRLIRERLARERR